MKEAIHFNISKGYQYYVAECNELPIVAQGITLDETITNIQEALQLHLEDKDLSKYEIKVSELR